MPTSKKAESDSGPRSAVTRAFANELGTLVHGAREGLLHEVLRLVIVTGQAARESVQRIEMLEGGTRQRRGKGLSHLIRTVNRLSLSVPTSSPSPYPRDCHPSQSSHTSWSSPTLALPPRQRMLSKLRHFAFTRSAL